MNASPFLVAIAGSPAGPGHDVLRPDENIWLAWTFDPVLLLGVGIAVWAYARGQRALPTTSPSASPWRAMSFYTGLLAIVVALASPVDALSSHQFSMHMAQHLLLTTAVLLVLLGAPGVPLLAGLPGPWRRRALALGRQPWVAGTWRVLAHPAVAFTLSVGVTAAWHLAPGWYDAAYANDRLHYLQHATFTGTAVLFWWNVVDPVPWQPRLGYLARMGYVLAHGMFEMGIGLTIALADSPLYASYATVRPVFPLTALEDQQLGGLVMLIVGELIDLAVATALFGTWWGALASRDAAATLGAAGETGRPPAIR